MCSGWLHHEILNSPDVPGRNDAGGGTGDGSALRLVMAGRRLGLLKRHVNALRASFVFIQRLLPSALVRPLLVSVRFPVPGWVGALGKEVLQHWERHTQALPTVTWCAFWILEETLVEPQGSGGILVAGLSLRLPYPCWALCGREVSSSRVEVKVVESSPDWLGVPQGAPPWGLEPSGSGPSALGHGHRPGARCVPVPGGYRWADGRGSSCRPCSRGEAPHLGPRRSCKPPFLFGYTAGQHGSRLPM